MMEQAIIVPIADVVIGARKRPLNPERVSSLRDSIAEVGLLQPIVVTDRYGLVAGRHRLEAVRQLGWLTIPARVAPLDDLRAELAEIDENLMRAELTALEQGEHLARRSEILEALGERARVGWNGNQYTKVGGGIIPPPIHTTAAIAGEMGISESSAHKRLQIARNLSPEVREAIADTPLADRLTDLLDLARLEPDEQRLVVAVEGVKEGRTAVRYARRKLGAQRAEERTQARQDMAASPGAVESSAPVRLIVGDAAQLDLPAESVDVIITSPPYNLGRDESWPMGGHGRVERDGIAYNGHDDAMPDDKYQEWQLCVLAELYRVARPGASLFYNHKTRTQGGRLWHPMAWLGRAVGWTIRQEIVWDREVTHNHSASLFWPVDERIYWLTKGKPALYDGPIGMATVWRFHGPQPHTWHPAPFGEELPRRCLQAIGGQGLVVLDPFAGSCTTLKVAAGMGHQAIGVDVCAEYLERARVEHGW